MKSTILSKEARWLALGLLVVSVVVWIGWTAPWQSARAQAQKVTFIYSAKYVCAPDFGPPDPALVPGIYKTAINVRNFLAQEVKFTKKVVVSRGQDEPRGPISERETVTLKPDEAIDIDCPDMAKLLKEQKAGSPKGFVVIESPVELEVVAVYTNEIVTREEKSEERRGFTCWNKIVYFEPPITTPGSKPMLKPVGQQELPIPNKVHEIVLPCPPLPKSMNIPAGGQDRQSVPQGVNSVTIVNPAGGNPAVTVRVNNAVPQRADGAGPVPGGGVVPAGAPAIPISVNPNDEVTITVPAGAPASNIVKTYGISDLEGYLNRLLGAPAGPPPPGKFRQYAVMKKIVDVERSNKVLYVPKAPVQFQPFVPVPLGKVAEIILPPPPVGVSINVGEAVRSAINEQLTSAGQRPLPPEVGIEIIDVEYGVGVGATSVGPEVEMGIGQGVGFGLGLGVGAGISIDVEYIQPKRVER